MAAPNILFIITDHQAWLQHQHPGQYPLDLPTWRQFCSQGVSFERAYSVCPLCTPARASMLTGVYPSAHGLTSNTDDPSAQRDLRSGQQIYSHHLSRAGYRNAYVGKWHCGHGRLPVDYGIEGWSLPDYGKVYMSDAYQHYATQRGLGEARARIDYHLERPQWAGQTITLHHDSPWYFMNGCGVLEGPPEAHENQFVAHLAIEKLNELARGSQPFSLVASFWGPHQPYYPTEPFASMIDPASIPEYPSFRDDLRGRPMTHFLHREMHHPAAKGWRDWSIWQRVLARAFGQQVQLDAAIGSLFERLSALGLADNTLVIWCADHGDALATHGGLWDKASTMTDEVMRVPMAIRWPAGFAGGRRCDALVSNLDVTATMLAAAGRALPSEMHSRDLLPLCHDQKNTWADELICDHYGHVEKAYQRMVRWKQYKYVASVFDQHELYDLERDPYEMRNLIADPGYADTAREARARLRSHIARRGEESRESHQLLVALNRLES